MIRGERMLHLLFMEGVLCTIGQLSHARTGWAVKKTFCVKMQCRRKNVDPRFDKRTNGASNEKYEHVTKKTFGQK
ncbi:hypothetical protein GLOIN_2v1580097 [Rhizophagus irregularis DAOM 181602=DAOM 197198]|uniref:Secreted protein n=1 Tax=Rhizophagus irregularis (strain DAOM 181602 / DAOM 197198 / MUCL 43194) TaxID=747089 RepID=A0A2P4Q8Q8_RHIID|nr:hypothetical protein GLOIN_2v1580097 [Rhizophagus irregularis DAOM 181602=DAOM 197198]POG74020.1 hypothetical protein GLOIN_2v1580097 [Rhizophagus irregularis DAOM 181602=DAOM 197198]GET58247.1 hypothetical protein GLOIN_2v1580097 [Rhizophagus irregularis DAOM 181602=DAOM 197198]|eukprot:XP_025180886.1 hypothetical protein GLOIN_2v1580097 [Rhizophagus irregularis DAOM 181602=DAOM 197198]